MSFDFMKEFMMFEDEERFAGLCEQIEDVIRDSEAGEGKVSELEIMRALDFGNVVLRCVLIAYLFRLLGSTP